MSDLQPTFIFTLSKALDRCTSSELRTAHEALEDTVVAMRAVGAPEAAVSAVYWTRQVIAGAAADRAAYLLSMGAELDDTELADSMSGLAPTPANRSVDVAASDRPLEVEQGGPA